MPIYDFKCKDCGRVFEMLVRNTDNQAIICPDCGVGSLEKLISSPVLVKAGRPSPGGTCCGRAERCASPPCNDGEGCRRH
jgi:putative FmdB family regulatory protein